MKKRPKSHIADPSRWGTTVCGKPDPLGKGYIITPIEFTGCKGFYVHPNDCKTCFRIVNNEAFIVLG